MTDTWTCHCGQITLELRPGEKVAGYVPPIEDGSTTYWWHAKDLYERQTRLPEIFKDLFNEQPGSLSD